MCHVHPHLAEIGIPPSPAVHYCVASLRRSFGLLTNVPVQLAGKTVLIDIEVINAQLDYNLLLGRSYMYAMRAVSSSVFHTMMFPHEGRVVKVDQLTYYDPNAPAAPENVLPMVEQPVLGATTSFVSSMGHGVYSDAPMT